MTGLVRKWSENWFGNDFWTGPEIQSGNALPKGRGYNFRTDEIPDLKFGLRSLTGGNGDLSFEVGCVDEMDVMDVMDVTDGADL